jgi:DNA repair protein RadC
MVHNHPSGDPTPSRADIDMTRKVKDAAMSVGLILHDHVIVSRGGAKSFKNDGLL